MKSIFIGAGGLRSGWRFLLFLLGTLTLQGVVQWIVISVFRYQPAKGWTSSDLLLSEAIAVFVVWLTTFLTARIEKTSVAAYGLPRPGAFRTQWIEGLLWGALAPALAMAMIVAAGAARIDGFALQGSALAKAAIVWFLIMILLGLNEELLFRGYPQHVLARGMGFWPAAVLMSVLFGALHFFLKPMENWVDATMVGLLGLFVCLTLKRTGNLRFAIGFHTGFDYVALNVLGAPNTGNEGKPVADHFLDTHFTGAAWITGGPRGIEASAFMFVVIAVLFAAALLRWRGKPVERRPPSAAEA
ncbi:MAG: hypothetical protein DMF56_16765 [Acidobacteria bacterium]|nr:MAG: hypothetical protein DMF56_16765 [Acidobacteriota bacterium]